MTMTPILSLSSLLDSVTPEPLVGWLWRMTLIAALGCAYLALARRAHPATRHAVAIGCLFAVVLLPLAAAVLPSWPLAILPGRAAPPEEPRNTTAGAPSGFAFAIDETATSTPSPSDSAPERVAREPVTAARVSPVWLLREMVGAATWTRVILLAWYVVAVGLLLRTAIGYLAARDFALRALLARDSAVILERERARRALGLRRPIEVAVSPEIAIPMVVGAVRPRVILPVAAAAWSRERLGAVLLHELAHVLRRDGLWALATQVVTAVFWFHPLVWVLARHARREAERACDEIVIANGVSGADYAEHLVAIARTAVARDPFAGSALALAARSTLERRIVSILSGRARHGAGSRRALAAVAGGVLALLVGVVVVKPTTVVSAESGAKTPDTAISAAAIDAPSESDAAGEPTYYVAGNDYSKRTGEEWYDRASDLYHRERYARAAEAYENAAHYGYRRGTALYNAGCSYALSNQEGRAIDALRAAFDEGFYQADLFASDDDLNSLRDDPRFKELLDDVMSTPAAESARRAAMRDYERLQKRAQVEEGDWNSVGIDLMRSGDYEHAADAFDREFKIAQDEDALYNKACARSLAGQTDEALKLLEQAIKTGSVGADHMAEDSDLVALHDKKGFDELIELAEDLELNPGWKFSWDGDDYKVWRKSLPRFEQVTREHPDIGRAWFNLGYAQLEADEPEQSIPSFQRALDLKHRPATTMYNLGCAAAQAGDIDAALAWLGKADDAGFEMWPHAKGDDDLDPLRSDSRFKSLMKKWRADAREKDKHKDDFDDAELDG